jgi:predicted amidophosphoribosyltransferase
MSANTTHPVCKSCGKSTRTAKRPTYCASCADALATFAAKFGETAVLLAPWDVYRGDDGLLYLA